MKIKRFVARDMRSAIAAVRKEIGEDAVILSNKSVDDGVELVAAIDFDEEQINTRLNTAREQQPKTAQSSRKPASVKQTVHTNRRTEQELESKQPHQASGYKPVSEDHQPETQGTESIQAMHKEMQALRRMMENGLSDISWREMGDHKPHSKEMFRQLVNMGLSNQLAERLMHTAESNESFDQQWQKAMFCLSSEISITRDDITDTGGIVAVVGPTGVGKTTSIAKLAARYCLRHGNRHVALISTDNYRIGAREQLHTYGRILNVPVRTASNAEELIETLNIFAEKRFILIDTAGMSHQDTQLSEQLTMLENAGRKVNRYLALSATTELSALRRAIKSFAPINPDALLITKTDEAASLGGILSVVISSGLPLAYYTDGQKVPEDMHVARAKPLVSLASSLAADSSEQYGDSYLACALTEARTHAYP